MTRRGFTLIELLAAVFISSIVVSASFILMTSTTNSFNDEDERRKLKSNLRIAELLIQRDIARTGYMFPFKTIKNDNTPHDSMWNLSNTPDITAFKYYNTENAFSAFTVIASLSDFLEFQIERVNAQELCIRSQITMPLTAADIGNLGTDANPVAQNADEQTFYAAFSRTFRDVEVIAIQNPTGRYIVTETEPITLPETAESTNCNYIIKLKNVSTKPPSVEGFEGSNFLEGSNVFPIVAVSYVVDANNDLLRCVHNPLVSIDSHVEIAALDTCEILIHDIQYFEVFPLIAQGNVSSFFNGMSNAADGGIKSLYGANGQHDLWSDSIMDITRLRGVYFRFGAITPVPAEIKQSDEFTDGPTVAKPYPGYTKILNEIYPLEHLQGIAAFKNNTTL